MSSSSYLELIAVVLGIVYLLLVVKENILCWYAAFISTAIFLYIFIDVKLYMESGLQVYYLIMAVYGYWQWNRTSKADNDASLVELKIHTWPYRYHLYAIGFTLLASLVSGYVLAEYTDAKIPYLDSFTTWGSLITTYMVTRKILENWIYWLVIDSISIYLYLDRGLYFTAVLFAVFLVIVINGWFKWSRQLKQQTA